MVTRRKANRHSCKCAPQPRLLVTVIFRCIKKGHLEAGLRNVRLLKLLALQLGREDLGDAMSTLEALSMTKTQARTPSSALGGPQKT